MSLPAAEVAQNPATSPGGWFEWRYAAAGLGAGALVGAVTGLVVGLVLTVVFALDADPGVGIFALVLTMPLLGLVVGLFSGALVGAVTGFVVALVCSRVREVGRARVAVAVTTFVAGMAASPLLYWLAGQMRGQEELGAGLTPLGLALSLAALALPCLAGAWLMARSVPSVLRHTADRHLLPSTLL